MTGRPDLGEKFDPSVIRLITDVTIVAMPKLWSEDVRVEIIHALRAAYGRVPTLNDLAQRYGDDLVAEVSRRTVTERFDAVREWQERQGVHSPCVFCGGPRREDDPFYPFGLAQNVRKETHWGGALASLAMNIVTVPLGVVVGAGPGSTTTAQIARCRLVMCQTCAPKCCDRFGDWIITERECRFHPSWERLYRAGFTTFLDHEQLARFR